MFWLTLLACGPPDFSAIQLSEVVAENTTAGGGLLDSYGESSAWLELHNSGEEPRRLLGLWLADEEGTLWPFPEDVVLDGGSYLIVFLDKDERLDSELHADLLVEDAGSLTLWDAERELDRVTWPNQVADVSWARFAAGWQQAVPTPLAANQATDEAETDEAQ